MNLKFNTTSIANDYVTALKPYYFELRPEDTVNILDTFMVSMSEFLKLKKNKDAKIALAVKDEKGFFKMAGIVSYHANEDADMPGNWSYEQTFNEEDVNDATVFDISDDDFITVLDTTAFSLHNMRFTQKSFSLTLIRKLVDVIINWLDVNAKEAEEVEVELDGYFKATVAVENGVKVMAITPDGAMKRLIKDDDALSK